jgi:hypothetical protein
MNTQNEIIEWINKELEELPNKKEYEDIPGLVFEENKTKVISIDTSKPFDKWVSPDNKIKKLIPVIDGTERKLWWLNVQNPTYKEILQELVKGIKTFKILQTGTKEKTKYILIKD